MAGGEGRLKRSSDQAREAANFERIYPLLLQTPGIRPQWLAERAVRIADDSTDLTDAYEEGLPSILTQNRMAQASTGDPATDPNAQGDQGGDKNRAHRPRLEQVPLGLQRASWSGSDCGMWCVMPPPAP